MRFRAATTSYSSPRCMVASPLTEEKPNGGIGSQPPVVRVWAMTGIEKRGVVNGRPGQPRRPEHAAQLSSPQGGPAGGNGG
jgi:hypothetical protein